MRRPARHSTTMSARSRAACSKRDSQSMHGSDELEGAPPNSGKALVRAPDPSLQDEACGCAPPRRAYPDREAGFVRRQRATGTRPAQDSVCASAFGSPRRSGWPARASSGPAPPAHLLLEHELRSSGASAPGGRAPECATQRAAGHGLQDHAGEDISKSSFVRRLPCHGATEEKARDVVGGGEHGACSVRVSPLPSRCGASA